MGLISRTLCPCYLKYFNYQKSFIAPLNYKKSSSGFFPFDIFWNPKVKDYSLLTLTFPFPNTKITEITNVQPHGG